MDALMKNPEQMYAVRESPAKGLGVLAISDIPQGTRIMAEKALVHLKPDLPTTFAYQAFLQLDETSQEVFTTLSCADTSKTDQYEQDIRDSGFMDPDHPDPDEFAGEGGMVLTLFENNDFALGCGGRFGSAVFHDASRINHSCQPNACQTWNERRKLHVVHALRDIKAGEEIFISYVPMFMPTSERNEILRERWNFECLCGACDVRFPEGIMSTLKRQRLCDKWMSLQQYLRQGTERIILATISDKAGGLLRLCEDEDINGWEKGLLYRELAAVYEQRSDLNLAVGCQEEAVRIAEYCFGEDDPLVEELVRELELFYGRRNGTFVLHVE